MSGFCWVYENVLSHLILGARARWVLHTDPCFLEFLSARLSPVGLSERVLQGLPGVRALKGFPDRGERQCERLVMHCSSTASRGVQDIRLGGPEETAQGSPGRAGRKGVAGRRNSMEEHGEAGVRHVQGQAGALPCSKWMCTCILGMHTRVQIGVCVCV